MVEVVLAELVHLPKANRHCILAKLLTSRPVHLNGPFFCAPILGFPLLRLGLTARDMPLVKNQNMSNRNSRRSPAPDSFVIICDLGNKLRTQYGEVRYVTRIVHNDQQWTIEATWERREADRWIEFDLPLENY